MRSGRWRWGSARWVSSKMRKRKGGCREGLRGKWRQGESVLVCGNAIKRGIKRRRETEGWREGEWEGKIAVGMGSDASAGGSQTRPHRHRRCCINSIETISYDKQIFIIDFNLSWSLKKKKKKRGRKTKENEFKYEIK